MKVNAVEVSAVSRHYRKKQVLREISFDVESGESVVIVGKNGCGKSTLLQIMAGAQKADSGSITYFGNKVGCGKSSRKYYGYVPQENPLFEELSVKDNLKFWGAGKKENLNSVIEQFQLEEMLHMKVEKLSGGMKRRLAIACAFVELPPVLLLDEPTAALDIYYKESILEWLSKYKQMNHDLPRGTGNCVCGSLSADGQWADAGAEQKSTKEAGRNQDIYQQKNMKII